MSMKGNTNNFDAKKFKELYDLIFQSNFISTIHQDIRKILIFPLIILILVIDTYLIDFEPHIKVLAIICGFFSVHLNFIISHMWIHTLMFHYEMWSIEEMIKNIGMISPIFFHEFYRHHHKNNENLLEWDSLPTHHLITGPHSFTSGPLSIIISHWVSFSLFLSTYPFSVYPIVFTVWFIYPTITPYFLGYEIGVLLLPFYIDMTFFKIIFKEICFVLPNCFNLGINVMRKDNIEKKFIPQGLYGKFLDAIFAETRNRICDFENNLVIELHQVIWYVMVITLIGQFYYFPYFIISLSSIQ